MLLAQISKVKVPENLDVNLTRIFPSQVLHWNLNIDFVLFSFNKVYLPSLDESYIYIQQQNDWFYVKVHGTQATASNFCMGKTIKEVVHIINLNF